MNEGEIRVPPIGQGEQLVS